MIQRDSASFHHHRCPAPVMPFRLSCGMGLSSAALTPVGECEHSSDISPRGESETKKPTLMGWLVWKKLEDRSLTKPTHQNRLIRPSISASTPARFSPDAPIIIIFRIGESIFSYPLLTSFPSCKASVIACTANLFQVIPRVWLWAFDASSSDTGSLTLITVDGGLVALPLLFGMVPAGLPRIVLPSLFRCCSAAVWEY